VDANCPGDPGSRPFLDIQARNTRSSGANLGFVIFRRRQPQMSIPTDRLAPSGPHMFAHFTFPIREPHPEPIHFPLDLVPSLLILYNNTGYL